MEDLQAPEGTNDRKENKKTKTKGEQYTFYPFSFLINDLLLIISLSLTLPLYLSISVWLPTSFSPSPRMEPPILLSFW